MKQNTKNNCDPTDTWTCHSRGLRQKYLYLLQGEIGLNLKLTKSYEHETYMAFSERWLTMYKAKK